MNDTVTEFEVTVGTSVRKNEPVAVAEAMRSLAVGGDEHVSTVLEDSELLDVNVYGSGDQQIGVGLVLGIETLDDVRYNALRNTKHVEQVEEVAFVQP